MRQHLRNAATALLLALTAAPAAFAHAHPVKMTPEKDSIIAAPAQVSITFSEALEPKFSLLELQDSAGAVVSKDHSMPDPADPTHLTLSLPPLAPAVYTVHWVSVATDGHRLEGKYNFTVK
jgi:methionine-rich copper-binding protein CopC